MHERLKGFEYRLVLLLAGALLGVTLGQTAKHGVNIEQLALIGIASVVCVVLVLLNAIGGGDE
jgi:hypothetical protein